jgi:hypothetical protein
MKSIYSAHEKNEGVLIYTYRKCNICSICRMTQSVYQLVYGLKVPWFDSMQTKDDFTLGPTKSTIQSLTWIFFRG